MWPTSHVFYRTKCQTCFLSFHSVTLSSESMFFSHRKRHTLNQVIILAYNYTSAVLTEIVGGY